jgi:CubicO group peptidase (beta-lactamase class C family)
MSSCEFFPRFLRTFSLSGLIAVSGVAGCQITPDQEVTAPRSPPRDTTRPGAAALAAARSTGEAIDAVFSPTIEGRSPGCALGVYREGEMVYARGYGFADLEHDVPITETTVFDLGSVSKQFTAAAIVLLVEDGKLSLDDDVRKHLPELPSYGKPITLRHLLHHTSGLRDYTDLLAIDGHDDADLTGEADALFAVTHQHALNFPPGSGWSYSNTGYFLLSLVVERVTGETLAAFENERIFAPLGMSDTHVHDDHRRLVPRRAIAYSNGDDGRLGLAMSDFEQTGDGAVMTTVRDLARWNGNFASAQVGGTPLLAALRTPGHRDDGATLTYAMGLFIDDVNGVPREWHRGSWAGYRAAFMRFPTANLGIAVLCNSAEATPVTLAMAVAGVFLPQLTAANPGSTAQLDAAAIVGTYLDRESLQVREVRAHGGVIGVRTSLDAAKESELDPLDAGAFAVKGTMIHIAFAPGSSQELLEKQGDGSAQAFERFDPAAVAAAPLQEYAGRYESDEIAADMDLIVHEGRLVAGPHGRAPTRRLVPVIQDGFEGGGMGFRFERDGHGEIQGFSLSANQIRGIRWKKR